VRPTPQHTYNSRSALCVGGPPPPHCTCMRSAMRRDRARHASFSLKNTPGSAALALAAGPAVLGDGPELAAAAAANHPRPPPALLTLSPLLQGGSPGADAAMVSTRWGSATSSRVLHPSYHAEPRQATGLPAKSRRLGHTAMAFVVCTAAFDPVCRESMSGWSDTGNGVSSPFITAFDCSDMPAACIHGMRST
jgi:hypothetical protein